MTETDYVHLILQNRASGVFTTRELSRWIEQSCGLKRDTARKRALRILTRLPIEAVSEKMFKIRTDVALAVNRDFGQKTQASAISPEEGGSESKKIKKGKKEKEDSPVLLLDDVFSELDRNRQKMLLIAAQDCQTFLTCTHLEEVAAAGVQQMQVYQVANRRVVEL